MIHIKLGDVLDVKRGTSLAGEFYSTEGKYIRLTLGHFNYPNGGFKDNTSKDDIYYTGTIRPEFVLKKGDIITPLTEQVSGLLGETATIPADDLYYHSADIGLVLPNEDKLDKRFAYYLLSSPLVKKQLGAGAQQTKIRHTSPDAIKACEAWIPEDLCVQQSIATIFDEISSKISNNNAICADLENMAKLLYDYWFVQFDFPDENGKPYKSSGGKMVWNEELKREIPEGWEVKPFGDLVVMGNGINYDKKVSGDKTYRIVNVRNITSSSLILDESDLDKIILRQQQAEHYLVAEGDLLIARSGAPGSIRLFFNKPQDIIYCGFIIHALPYNLLYRWYLANTIKAYEGTSATKTGGSILQNVSQETLARILILLPPQRILEKYNMAVLPAYSQIDTSIKENQQLASLRDFLLPMLMNGQVKVGKEDINV